MSHQRFLTGMSHIIRVIRYGSSFLINWFRMRWVTWVYLILWLIKHWHSSLLKLVLTHLINCTKRMWQLMWQIMWQMSHRTCHVILITWLGSILAVIVLLTVYWIRFSERSNSYWSTCNQFCCCCWRLHTYQYS